MSSYIDPSRRFRDLTPTELEGSEFLTSFNNHHYASISSDWNEIASELVY